MADDLQELDLDDLDLVAGGGGSCIDPNGTP